MKRGVTTRHAPEGSNIPFSVRLWHGGGHDYGASTDRDRFTYGYDRASNRLYRENTVAGGKDEFYTYDGANRLATFDRGDLNAGKTAISGTPVKGEQ